MKPVISIIACCLVVATTFGHPCERECVSGSTMTCEYNFALEWYSTLSKACFDCPYNITDCSRRDCIPGDGFERSVTVVNRQLPGPAISVCEGDVVVVNVKNHLTNGEGTAIHWHGLHQRNNQWMDGVPMLTQCPIPAMSSHQYQFSAEPAGTHWWHAHAGFQRGDGAAGALIVRKPKSFEPHASLYDVDDDSHIMLLGDWLHQTTMDKFVMHHHSSGNNKGEGMLINGKGVFTEFVSGNETHWTPRSECTVEANLRYRFRVISNAVVFCPMEFSIDQHNLTVINSDGRDIEPITVSTLTLHGGERYDFVLEANQIPASYWVRVQGVADCVNQSQTAILRYTDSSDTGLPTSSDHLRVSNLNPLHHNSIVGPIYAGQLRSAAPIDPRLRGTPDKVHFFGFDFKKVDNEMFHRAAYYPITALPRNHHLYTPQINNVTFASPDRPLLYQLDTFDRSKLCDPQITPTMGGKFRSCVHNVKIPKDKLIEMVIFDEGFTFNAGHPMHLHGQHFAVVAMDRVGVNLSLEEIKALHAAGNITYELTNPPMKDTVIVPDGGYTIVRFMSDNPGFWAFHCHLSFHLETGMMLTLQVGEPEDFTPLVPQDYPRCGSYRGGKQLVSAATSTVSSLAINIVFTVVSSMLMLL